MNYVTVKNADAIKLDGVTITFDKADDTLKAVYFRDTKGNHCRVTYENYTCLRAQVPAPPKMETRHVLRGVLPVVGEFSKQFEERHEADKAKRELENSHREDVELTITSEEVVVEPAAKTTDDIPF